MFNVDGSASIPPPSLLIQQKKRSGVNPFTTGNPFLGTKLLGFSIGRGSGVPKGLSHPTLEVRHNFPRIF